jgi:uncharacterized protein
VEGHGALLPEHVHAEGGEPRALAPLEAQVKFRRLDGANDAATLVNALALGGASEAAELFARRYAAATRDRDLPRVLPLYRVLQALRGGLARSEWSAEHPPESKERQELTRAAGACYALALETARALPRPE